MPNRLALPHDAATVASLVLAALFGFLFVAAQTAQADSCTHSDASGAAALVVYGAT